MTHFELLTLALGVLSVLLIPALVILVRGAIKWTRTEDRLSTLVTDMGKLMRDKEKIHSEMLSQMKADREATDTRLRYLERFWMEMGRQHWKGPEAPWRTP